VFASKSYETKVATKRSKNGLPCFNARAFVHRTVDKAAPKFRNQLSYFGRLCGLVVRVLGYRSGGPGSIPGTTRKKKVVGLERGPLTLVSTTEELLDRKVAAYV
jgi:hypothetical protein